MRARIQAVIDAKPELTVRKVSLSAGLSDSMLGKFLKGDVESLTIKTAEKLADALSVDPRWLIFGEGDPEQANDLTTLFARIPEGQRAQALRILETFARTGTDG